MAPDLFAGFREGTFPATSMPALALTHAAYRSDPGTGEDVALRLRNLLFEEGVDIADPSVLAAVAAEHGVDGPLDDTDPVLADHVEGTRAGRDRLTSLLHRQRRLLLPVPAGEP